MSATMLPSRSQARLILIGTALLLTLDMPQGEAQSAIQALNGFQMNGRPLRVNEAQERPQRPRQGGGPFRR